MRLSILICRMPSRYAQWGRLHTNLCRQILPYAGQIEVLSEDRMDISVGEKRNLLLGRSDGEYVCFIDDDDEISSDYVRLLMEAVESGMDCASLKGEYYINGKFDGVFEHSIKYLEWETVEGEVKYLRFPNHLNCIKSSIAKQFRFPEKNYGEDFDWSTIVHKSGLIKTEHYITEVLYYYKYVSNK